MYVKHSARSADRLLVCVFCLLIRPPPPSTLFPYTTLFRSSLAGLRVGILDNSKPNAEVLLGRVAELLVARAGAGPVTVWRKPGASRPATVIAEVVAGSDVVLTGSAD